MTNRLEITYRVYIYYDMTYRNDNKLNKYLTTYKMWE